MSEAQRQPPPFRYELEGAKIREFAQAMGGLDAVHTDRAAARAAGYRDIVAPIGLIVWTIPQDRDRVFEAFGLAADRGLTTSEGWDLHAPICAGDVLTGQTRHLGKEVREGRSGPAELHRLETAYHNQLGELALVEHTTIMQWAVSPFRKEGAGA